MIKTGLKTVLLSHLIEARPHVCAVELNTIYKAITRNNPDGESQLQIKKSVM